MTKQDLVFLQSKQEYPSVSIFVRTHRQMPQRESDPIAVKNAASRAKEILLKEFSQRELEPLFAHLDELVNSIDYSQVLDGLALFVNASFKQLYILPIPVETQVVVDSTFDTRGILKIITRIPRYWVLALSEDPTRFFYGLGETVSEVIEPENDTLGISRDGFPLDYTKPDVEAHGYRMGDHMVKESHLDSQYFDDKKRAFYKKVEHLLTRFTHTEPLPLFVVGTERNIALFKDVHQGTDITGVAHGDFANKNASEVAKVVYPLVQKYLEQARKQKRDELVAAIGRQHGATGIVQVWRMARAGRVNDLLVEEGFTASAQISRDNPDDLIFSENATKPQGNEDFVNVIIEEVVQKGGGKVTFFKPGELAEFKQIGAILRY